MHASVHLNALTHTNTRYRSLHALTKCTGCRLNMKGACPKYQIYARARSICPTHMNTGVHARGVLNVNEIVVCAIVCECLMCAFVWVSRASLIFIVVVRLARAFIGTHTHTRVRSSLNRALPDRCQHKNPKLKRETKIDRFDKCE